MRENSLLSFYKSTAQNMDWDDNLALGNMKGLLALLDLLEKRRYLTAYRVEYV